MEPLIVHLVADTEVKPTEDVDKVERAISSLLTGVVETIPRDRNYYVTHLESTLISSLDRFRMVLKRDRIRSAARAVMLRNIYGDKLEFYLNKQVAFAGHVSFSQAEGESPLGPIHVVVTSPNIVRVVDWLTR